MLTTFAIRKRTEYLCHGTFNYPQGSITTRGHNHHLLAAVYWNHRCSKAKAAEAEPRANIRKYQIDNATETGDHDRFPSRSKVMLRCPPVIRKATYHEPQVPTHELRAPNQASSNPWLPGWGWGAPIPRTGASEKKLQASVCVKQIAFC